MVVALAQPNLGLLTRSPVSPEAAAQLLNVPVSQVVETLDGAIAFDLVGGSEPTMHVYLVTDEMGLRQTLLVRAAVAATLFDDQIATVWGDWISCSTELGLAQPNFVVGGGNPPPIYVAVENASGTASHDRFFLSVLEPGDVAGPIMATMGNGAFTTQDGAFDNSDACRGEVISPH